MSSSLALTLQWSTNLYLSVFIYPLSDTCVIDQASKPHTIKLFSLCVYVWVYVRACELYDMTWYMIWCMVWLWYDIWCGMIWYDTYLIAIGLTPRVRRVQFNHINFESDNSSSVSGHNRIPNSQTWLKFSWHIYQTQSVVAGRRLFTDLLVYRFLHDWRERHGLMLRDFSDMLAFCKSQAYFFKDLPDSPSYPLPPKCDGV
jgi:hypothetical protein